MAFDEMSTLASIEVGGAGGDGGDGGVTISLGRGSGTSTTGACGGGGTGDGFGGDRFFTGGDDRHHDVALLLSHGLGSHGGDQEHHERGQMQGNYKRDADDARPAQPLVIGLFVPVND